MIFGVEELLDKICLRKKTPLKLPESPIQQSTNLQQNSGMKTCEELLRQSNIFRLLISPWE